MLRPILPRYLERRSGRGWQGNRPANTRLRSADARAASRERERERDHGTTPLRREQTLSHSLRENFLLESENFVLLGRFMVAAIQKHALWQVALEGEQRAEDTHAVRSAIRSHR